MSDVVIVGGGYAGVTCALRLGNRIRQLGLTARVRLVSARPALVERIRLHQFVTGQPLPERSLQDQVAGSGVELVHGTAQAIDLGARTLRVGEHELGWDWLVLAGGSATDVRAVPGAARHAVTIDLDSAPSVMHQLGSLPQGAKVVVIGGGLTGIEVSSEVAETYPDLEVHLVSGGAVAQGFSRAGRAHVRKALRQRLGVTLHEGEPVLAVDERRVRTAAADIPFDLCIWTAGFVAPPLASEAGLNTNAKGQVLVDAMQRSISHPRVYVAGDMGVPVAPAGQQPPMGCKSAMPLGAHVAENIVCELRGKPVREFDFALLFYCVSLGRRDGLVQWPDAAGRPVGRVLTGRAAAWVKEFICRSTVWAIQLERKGIPAVVWKHTGKVHGHVSRMEEGIGQ